VTAGAAELLAQDHHVHSTFSDDATSTVAENIAVAQARGLRTVCLADHVRTTTPWVPDFLSTVRSAADGADIEVLFGVEATILDDTGRLDLPDDLPPVHRILIADHQYPGRRGPVPADEVRRSLDNGDLRAQDLVQTLVWATILAMQRTPGAQLAHLFSLLPKVGLDEAVVAPDQIQALADTAYQTGAVVEANEKWDCPSSATLVEFVAAGVTVVAASGSHQSSDIGVYERVSALTDGIRATGS
jgi:putative hydrolase